MGMLPTLSESMQSRSVVDVFQGYDHELKIAEGAWYDEKNLTSDYFPIFAPRAPRGTFTDEFAGTLNGIIAKEALGYVKGNTLYYNGAKAMDLRGYEGNVQRQLVGMGAYICVFPDGMYYNTADVYDNGSMGAIYNAMPGTEADDTIVTFKPCKLDGSDWEGLETGATPPENPANGQYWLDTSGSKHALKVWSSSSSMWTQVAVTYVRIEREGIGAQFKEGDGITLSGVECSDINASADLIAQAKELNGDWILQGVSNDFIIITGIIDGMFTQKCKVDSYISVERKVPELDYVCEHNNRLWGCKYGFVDGHVINEIYACKLGDFKNWYAYAGTSMDSYAVSVGSDGAFTGCVSHLGYVLFFKENCIHKLYGTYPANYQLTTTVCRGVQRGSSGSLVVVNETLFYKSATDICAYDGSLPKSVSSVFGNERYYDATAGAHGGKYYVSMRDSNQKWSMYVFDTSNGIWHKEDDVHAIGFSAWGDELYYINYVENDGNVQTEIIAEHGTIKPDNKPVEWYAVSGMIGFTVQNGGNGSAGFHEYVSRLYFRAKLAMGATLTAEIEYDDSGRWEHQGTILGGRGTVGSFLMPVIPRRCEHFRIRLSGKGDCRIFSMSKMIEQGSDVG